MTKKSVEDDTPSDTEFKARIKELEAQVQLFVDQTQKLQLKLNAVTQQRNNAEDQIAELAATIATLQSANQ